ncbi:Uncharacterised protein [[Clostridium] sordellii]|uniref:Uncharacterized protein n=1 Tax=Paraclostridium sordellii TaxID=1505 RepID=A0A0C7QKL3_PARSO|nr:hypothetical protein [Paeniclostridium sordellii]CEQ04076.1 Uncharacterised protein [[Clostridium] sordellii] [Paeniclostridium sordellii]
MNTSEKLSLSEKRDIAIESGIQLIPGIGGALSSAYFGAKQAKQFKRLESFYQELSLEMKELKEKIIPMDEQYEDGLISLIEQINEGVEKEHQRKKIEFYKGYMKKLLTKPLTKSIYDKSKMFLDILESMTVLEIELLTHLYKFYLENSTSIEIRNISRQDLDQYAIVGIISKLKSYGFIRTVEQRLTFGGGQDNLLNDSIVLSNYGIEFIEFITR